MTINTKGATMNTTLKLTAAVAAKDAVELIAEIESGLKNYQTASFGGVKARAIIAALGLLRGVADGTHVIRPREPTQEQIEAALEFHENGKWNISDNSFFGGMYRAMITENE